MRAPQLQGWSAADRERLAAWIGEGPASILSVHALRTGLGRAWLEGPPQAPDAVLVEPALTGEPQGFGAPDALLGLLTRTEGWWCVEVDAATAASLRDGFARRFGLRGEVTDVVHVLDVDPPDVGHPLVRAVTVADLDDLVLDAGGVQLLPDRALCEPAARAGWLHAGIVDGRVVGHGGAFAAGETFADVGVAVQPQHRRQRLATAAAALTCRALRADGLVPTWGTGAHNEASLRTAARLGFREVSRWTYLVRADRPAAS